MAIANTTTPPAAARGPGRTSTSAASPSGTIQGSA
jgi:hypothetical protein